MSIFTNPGFMPHIHCYLDRPPLVWTMFLTDIIIGTAYVGISLILWILVRRVRIPFSPVVLAFGMFIAACGMTHYMEVWTLWNPDYWWAAGVKGVTALASVGTGIYLFQLRHPIVTVAEAARLSEQRRLDLEALTHTLEERVEARTAELAQAVRARDEFLSIASHELRTPLTSLRIHGQLLLRDLSQEAEAVTPDRMRKLAELTERHATRLTRLVEEMLDISRLSTGRMSMHPEPTDLAALVRESVERVRSQLAEAGCEVMVTAPLTLNASCDRLRIEQVLTNLLTNAARYAPDRPVEVELASIADQAVLLVRDHGTGVLPQDRARIFDRFERAISSSEVSGLGLGLFISREIVMGHGGTIRVEDTAGGGATFVVELPLAGSRA